jgi:hypothetical protein
MTILAQAEHFLRALPQLSVLEDAEIHGLASQLHKRKYHKGGFVFLQGQQVKKLFFVEMMDNQNTHVPGSLYEAFSPEKAKALWNRFQFVYTPKHGSWLNMAEIELNVLIGQCLNRRIAEIKVMRSKVKAWESARNGMNAGVNWQFTTENARIKLNRLYPTLEM